MHACLLNESLTRMQKVVKYSQEFLDYYAVTMELRTENCDLAYIQPFFRRNQIIMTAEVGRLACQSIQSLRMDWQASLRSRYVEQLPLWEVNIKPGTVDPPTGGQPLYKGH